MAEIRTVSTLRKKRRAIERTIADYEKSIADAKADLAHVNAVIDLFEHGENPEPRPYASLQKLFRRNEPSELCLKALAKGPLSTPQVGLYIAKAKGFEETDRVLLKTLTRTAIYTLGNLERRGKVVAAGRKNGQGKGGIRVWALPKGQ